MNHKLVKPNPGIKTGVIVFGEFFLEQLSSYLTEFQVQCL